MGARETGISGSLIWSKTLMELICSDAKERVGCRKQREATPHLFIPSKTAAMVPELAVEDLPLDRTTTLVPEFAVTDLPLSKTL